MSGKLSTYDLIVRIAEACRWAQEHFDDHGENFEDIGIAMEATSYHVACLLAQHTKLGGDGVEWSIVHDALCKHEKKDMQWWMNHATDLVVSYGGANK